MDAGPLGEILEEYLHSITLVLSRAPSSRRLSPFFIQEATSHWTGSSLGSGWEHTVLQDLCPGLKCFWLYLLLSLNAHLSVLRTQIKLSQWVTIFTLLSHPYWQFQDPGPCCLRQLSAGTWSQPLWGCIVKWHLSLSCPGSKRQTVQSFTKLWCFPHQCVSKCFGSSSRHSRIYEVHTWKMYSNFLLPKL